MFSLIICTYNRVEYLKDTIDSILLIAKQRSDVEILIIDNNSNDNTSYVVSQYVSNSSLVKYFCEINQGLSHARNRGIKEAKGEVLVFLDDDIDIEQRYLKILDQLYKNPSVSIVGGKVLPFGVTIPKWLPLKYYYLVSVFDIGDKAISTQYLMGANFSMRRNVAEATGWYNPELGRKGDNLMSGEENDYLDRARKKGYDVIYEPNLIVFHKIANKLNKKYVYTYAFENGKSTALFIRRQRGNLRYVLKILFAIVKISIFCFYGFYTPINRQKDTLRIDYRYSLGYLRGVLKTTFGIV